MIDLRVVIQKVSEASVWVEGEAISQIEEGLLILLGVSTTDTEDDIKYLVNKVSKMRVFADNQGKMNLSLEDIGGQALVVPQFTLYGDCRKGRRPSFTQAAVPDKANKLYKTFVGYLQKNIEVKTGQFQAHMQVSLVNDGPVTLLVESPSKGGELCT